MEDDNDYYPRAGKRADRLTEQGKAKGSYTAQMNLLLFSRSTVPHYVNQKDDTAHFWSEQGLKAVFYLRKNFWMVSTHRKRVYGTAEQFLTWWRDQQPTSEEEPSPASVRQRLDKLRAMLAQKSGGENE